jgi:hypothetical protein
MAGFWEKILPVYQAWSKPPLLICAIASPKIGPAVLRALFFKYHELIPIMTEREHIYFASFQLSLSGTEHHILELMSGLSSHRLPLAFTFFHQCSNRSFLEEAIAFAAKDGTIPLWKFPLLYAFSVRICWSQAVHSQFIEGCMSLLRQNTDASQAQPMIEARSVIAANKDLVPLLTDQNFSESAQLWRGRPSNFGSLEHVSQDAQIIANVQLLDAHKRGGKPAVVHKVKTHYCPYCGGTNDGETGPYAFPSGVVAHLQNVKKPHAFICKRAAENSTCRMRFVTESEKLKHERNNQCRPLSVEDNALLQLWQEKISLDRFRCPSQRLLLPLPLLLPLLLSSTSMPTPAYNKD